MKIGTTRLLLLLSFLSFIHYAQATDYYWVGNGGSWSDYFHWSTDPNMWVNPDMAIPTADDNAIFTNKSFNMPNQEVTLPTEAFVKDISFSGLSSSNPPTLHFPSNGATTSTLNVYGMLILSNRMEISYDVLANAFIKMVGVGMAPNPSVTGAGREIPNLEFNASGGVWSITDDLNVAGKLTVIEGTLNSGATSSRRAVNAGEFIINGPNAIVDLSRMDIVASIQFQVIELSAITIVGANPSNISSISTPRLAVTAPGPLNFGELIITGTDGIIDASGVQLTFIRDVILSGSASSTILGQHTFEEDLIITGAGVTIFFEAGSTQTLETDKLIVADDTDCENYITLRSTTDGVAAIIAKAPFDNKDVVSLSNIHIQDIHIDDGGVPYDSFEALNSVDLGNTDGWSIPFLGGITLYWIGGTGDWSEGNNWSAFPDGPPIHCMPTAADDVVFGANSFNGTNQKVTVDLPSIYVKSLTWTDPDGDAPTLEISSGNINIGGSLDIAPSVKLEIADPGNTYFNFISNDEMDTKTITLGTDKVVSGGFDLGNITFLGSGSWMLTTALNASGTIQFNKGSFEVEAGAPLYIYANEAIIDGENMDLTLEQAIFQVNIFNLLSVNTFDAGTSNISAELFEVTPEALTFHQVFIEGTEGELQGENLFFTDLTLNSSVKSTVYGSHTYHGELRFSQPGMIVEFEVDKIQYVSNITHPIPNEAVPCGGHLLVRSTVRGIQAIFEALPDDMAMIPDISVPNIILQDIMALPEMKFTAVNSEDQGNNTNWTFTGGATGNVYYWVGGTGNWSDASKWAPSSGGTAGPCSPFLIDDVVFDENSFSGGGQSITLDAAEQYCRNMTWTAVTNEPTMVLPARNNLNISGSLYLDGQPSEALVAGSTSGMTINAGNNSTFVFKSSTTGNEISTNGHTLPKVIFTGNGGGWILLDDLTATTDIQLTNGHLNLNTLGSPNIITAPEFRVNGPNASLSMGNAVLEISDQFQIININSLAAGTSTLRTNILASNVGMLMFNEVQLEDSGSSTDTELNADDLTIYSLYLKGTSSNTVFGSHSFNNALRFEIVPNGDVTSDPVFFNFQTGSTQTLNGSATIIIEGADLFDYPIIQSTNNGQIATIVKESGSVCIQFGAIYDIKAEGDATFAFNSINVNVPDNLSLGWTATVLACDILLPVECVDFTASVQSNNDVELVWTTAQEAGNKGFEVQRSIDGRRFETIAWIAGAGTTTEPQKYTYLDRRTEGLEEAYYRLLQLDLDGAGAFACDVQAVSFRSLTEGPLQIFPNPAGNKIQVRWFGKKAGPAIIRLFDQQGRLLLDREWDTLEGPNRQELPIADLPRGVYELQLLNADGQLEATRLVKQ